MSIIIGHGALITYFETELQCPICTFKFDASDKIDKAKYPVFKMKCKGCKAWIGISVPVFGGNTSCFEWNPPKVKDSPRLEYVTPFKVNGKEVVRKPYDDNSDEPSELMV
jgi:hypothetical protein